ncbi:PP2C family protein-serine/threonine phosphatase [Streptomyces spiralis]
MGPKGILAAATGALAVTLISATLHGAWHGEQVCGNLLGVVVVSVAGFTTSKSVQARRQGELDRIRRIAAARRAFCCIPSRRGWDPCGRPACISRPSRARRSGAICTRPCRPGKGSGGSWGTSGARGCRPYVRPRPCWVRSGRPRTTTRTLREVMNHCAAALRRESAAEEAVDGGPEGECFVTALVAQVPDGSVVVVVNRGHPPPMVLRRGRAQALVPDSPQPPLGLEELMTDPPAEPERYPFVPGDRLLLHTDGVIEARNRDNDFFALAEHMESVRHARTPREFLDRLHQSLIVHTEDRLVDDVAMVAVDRVA